LNLEKMVVFHEKIRLIKIEKDIYALGGGVI